MRDESASNPKTVSKRETTCEDAYAFEECLSSPAGALVCTECSSVVSKT